MGHNFLKTAYLYNRHNEVPVLTTWQATVEATHFNHVQTAMKRLSSEQGSGLRFRIPKLRHLDLILQKDAWIVVDRVLSDFPILCWIDFKTGHRDNLHQPVLCEIRIFHFAARMVLNKTINAMQRLLAEELSRLEPDDDFSVLQFNKRK